MALRSDLSLQGKSPAKARIIQGKKENKKQKQKNFNWWPWQLTNLMKKEDTVCFMQYGSPLYCVSNLQSRGPLCFFIPEYLMHIFTCSHIKIHTQHSHLTVNAM